MQRFTFSDEADRRSTYYMTPVNKETTMPVIEQKSVAELHQIHIELSLIRRAFCAYVEAKGVKIPGYDEPKREMVASTSRKKRQAAKSAK
jgi:hypothetical protein